MIKGSKHTQETKDLLSKNGKGVQFNTGRTHFKKGVAPWNKDTKGLMPVPWNADHNISKECCICFTRFKVPNCRKDSALYCSRRCLGIYKFTGERNPNWIGGGWLTVRKQILLEQDYTCQVCSLREPDIMEVNHKLERSVYPELAHDKNNMEVLCPNCHRRKTNLFLKSKKDICLQ